MPALPETGLGCVSLGVNAVPAKRFTSQFFPALIKEPVLKVMLLPAESVSAPALDKSAKFQVVFKLMVILLSACNRIWERPPLICEFNELIMVWFRVIFAG